MLKKNEAEFESIFTEEDKKQIRRIQEVYDKLTTDFDVFQARVSSSDSDELFYSKLARKN